MPKNLGDTRVGGKLSATKILVSDTSNQREGSKHTVPINSSFPLVVSKNQIDKQSKISHKNSITFGDLTKQESTSENLNIETLNLK